MKNKRLLEAIAVLVVGAVMLAMGWLLVNNDDMGAFVLFPISIGILLLGLVALFSALVSK